MEQTTGKNPIGFYQEFERTSYWYLRPDPEPVTSSSSSSKAKSIFARLGGWLSSICSIYSKNNTHPHVFSYGARGWS